MKSVKELITNNNLINVGETIGVAVSGGKDSMSLLHYLNTLSKELNFKIAAITIDHNLRENSAKDAAFVVDYCSKSDIRVYMYKVNVKKLSEDKGLTIEEAARECRYKVFNALISKGIVNKVALGHHLLDQVETVLLNIFRGTGLSGAAGMDVVRDGVFIRPLLKTTKREILAYIKEHKIPFVEDETNLNNDYSRNFIRNEVLPLIQKKWPNVENNIFNFAQTCRQDDEYILNNLNDNSVIYEKGNVSIPLNYFIYPNAIVFRIVLKALKNIGVATDIERKHLAIIKTFAGSGESFNNC